MMLYFFQFKTAGTFDVFRGGRLGKNITSEISHFLHELVFNCVFSTFDKSYAKENLGSQWMELD